MKYKLTEKTKIVHSVTLHQIQALKSFSNVKVGDLGGWIENEKNLSQSGDAWVYGNASVFDNAQIYDDARVCDNAIIWGDAMIYGRANVCCDAKIFGNSKVYDDAFIYDTATVYGHAQVCDNARIYGDAQVYGNACIEDETHVYGEVNISGDAKVCNDKDYTVIKGFGSEQNYTTFFKCKDGMARVVCDGFYGTIDEFRTKVKQEYGNSKYTQEYLMIADLMELHFKE